MSSPDKTPRRFVITGCGRSATMYIAELLTELGCDCGHEDYFPKAIRPSAYWLARARIRPLAWRRPPYGEAAWEAAPYLPLLPRETVVFHQIRHPLSFIRSRMRKGLSRAAFRDRHIATQATVSNKYQFRELSPEWQVEYLARFWVEWNELVERRARDMEYYRYRTDDLTQDHIAWMLRVLEWPVDRIRLKTAFEATSKTVNAGNSEQINVTLERLPQEVYERVQHLCTRYGFDL